MECVQEDYVELDKEAQNQCAKEASEPQRVSIPQAAKLHNVTRQAIYVAVKQNKLRASKGTRWEIDLRDLEEYKRNRYSRTKSLFQGELLFDNEKGFYSVNQAAEILNVPIQKIYYATRMGTMKGSRRGAAWVIHISEIERYKQEYLSKQLAKKAKAAVPAQEESADSQLA